MSTQPDPAEDLAVLIAQTWPSHRITVDDWYRTLQPLDVHIAGIAVDRLRRRHHAAISIEELLAEYRRLTPQPKPTRPAERYVSYTEHIQNLVARADNGDTAAAAELAIWERNHAAGLMIDRRREDTDAA